jgi:hypothetical protein
MISIDKIIGDSLFPTIDFKFHNSGNAVSYMHEFHIEVIEARLDKRPIFKAHLGIRRDLNQDVGLDGISIVDLSVMSGDLIVDISNNGWGGDVSCDIFIMDSFFQELFPEELLKTKLVLSGGERKQAFKLKASQVDQQKIKALLCENKKSNEIGLLSQDGHQGSVWELSIPDITLSYVDDIEKHQESINLEPTTESLYGVGGRLYLTGQSFKWRSGGEYGCACYHPPSAVYYAKIDPNNGAYVKKYKISHRIGKGDIERFKIMVGSVMSSNLKVVFRFIMEEGRFIESKVFAIDVWRPRNIKIPSYYENDGELIEKINKKRELLLKIFDKIDTDTVEKLLKKEKNLPLSIENDTDSKQKIVDEILDQMKKNTTGSSLSQKRKLSLPYDEKKDFCQGLLFEIASKIKECEREGLESDGLLSLLVDRIFYSAR